MKNSVILQIFSSLVILVLPLTAQQSISSIEDLKRLQDKTEAVAEKVLPSTVALTSTETGASGSGVIVQKDGLILTAAHVIDGVEEMEVIFPNGKQARAKVLGANYSKDIGMAKIIDEGEWPAVEIGTSKDLKAGDWVIAMGHSEGYDPARTPPVRFGRVVSDGPGNYMTTDCTLIGGDSGGPLLDLDGKVIGINSSIGKTLNNNNHAGVDGFKEDWDRLMSGESWGELQLNPLANPERPAIGILMGREMRDGGVPVEWVRPGSPAAKAGVRQGDIIRKVDGVRVEGGRSLGLLLAKFSAGETVGITVQRGRNMVELEVSLVRLDQLFEKPSR